jgi:hypothetical protein
MLQKTVTTNAATVSEYVSYLTKGQIPPKVCFVELTLYTFKVKNG